MGASWFQEFKQALVTLVPLDKDAWHIYVGMACLVVSRFCLRIPLTWFRVLALGLAASLAGEVLDLWRDYSTSGTFNWLASLNDIVNTNAIPTLVVVLMRWEMARKRVAEGQGQ